MMTVNMNRKVENHEHDRSLPNGINDKITCAHSEDRSALTSIFSV